MWDHSIFDNLQAKQTAVITGGGELRMQKQHERGKLSARERLEILFDPGTFTEVDAFVESRIDDFGMADKRVPGDGVVTGYGLVNGRDAFASSEDFTVHGGTMGEYHLKKICRILDMAYTMRAPYIGLFDGGGARIEEGIVSLAELGGVFSRNTRNSGVIPQIAAVMGPCAGGACYSPALCDFTFMVKNTSFMFLTGPQVVKTVTGEDVSTEMLGGSEMHASKSGVVDFVFNDDTACIQGIRRLLSYLPQNTYEKPPTASGTPMDLCKGLQEVVAENQRLCYDAHAIIGAIADKHSFFEVHKDFARNILAGLCRIDGRTVGVVANNPNHLGGALDVHASDKAARFIRFCDCFNIPLLTLVDVPAFLPGKEQEQAGIIRHGAKILYAYAEANVPRITVILRKAYGGAYIAMSSKLLGADIVFAWPIAQIAVMGAEGAVDILWKRKLETSENSTVEKDTLTAAYEEKFMNPYIAASRGFVDEVIHPEDTRKKIAAALTMLANKQKPQPGKRHGNMPL